MSNGIAAEADVVTTLNAMREAARAQTGLHDFGDEAEYVPGLTRLLHAIESEVTLTPTGKEFAFGVLAGTLAARLHAHEGWKRRPDCLTRPIAQPILIVGMPRTGTTALHRLLAVDAQFQVPERWLIDTPMPRPPRTAWEAHPAHRECAASMAMLRQLAPEYVTVHPIDADLADECLDILRQCFVSNLWATFFPVPSYEAWWLEQDQGPSYRYLQRVLQLMGADDRRRWLLKDPSSIHHLESVLETFPDAALIVTHRDPVKTMPSVSVMVRSIHRLLQGDAMEVRRDAEREVRSWSRSANAMTQWPDLAGRRVDVHLNDFQRDPMGMVRNIYRGLGLTLTAETETTMQAQVAHDQKAPRAPSYTLPEFGLDAGWIREQFDPYIRRFGPF